MSKYERQVWSRIYPSYTEQNVFGLEELEQSIEEVHGKNPSLLADPSCSKCYGRGLVGTLHVNMDTDPKGNFIFKPITEDAHQKNEITSRPLGCTCARKFMRTALRLAESHNKTLD
tara:strand:+ start:8315 stop:8662 length:348 start_codon:yes stop_codon:yes gene_type:complete